MADGDYEQLLTVLYSRKMTRTNFEKICSNFKKQTGSDLCDHVDFASKAMMKQINELPVAKKADQLRTMMFKLVDYEVWGGFCKTKSKTKGAANEGKKETKE